MTALRKRGTAIQKRISSLFATKEPASSKLCSWDHLPREMRQTIIQHVVDDLIERVIARNSNLIRSRPSFKRASRRRKFTRPFRRASQLDIVKDVQKLLHVSHGFRLDAKHIVERTLYGLRTNYDTVYEEFWRISHDAATSSGGKLSPEAEAGAMRLYHTTIDLYLIIDDFQTLVEKLMGVPDSEPLDSWTFFSFRTSTPESRGEFLTRS